MKRNSLIHAETFSQNHQNSLKPAGFFCLPLPRDPVDVQHLGTCSWHQWRHMNDMLLRARALRCHQESRWWTADKMCHRECLRSLWLSFTRASRRICRSFTLNTCSCARRAWDEGERISYGRVTGASCWAAEGKKEVYMVLILFFSCVSVSSNTLYEQQKQSISNTTTAAAVLHQCLPWNLFRFSHSPKVDDPGLYEKTQILVQTVCNCFVNRSGFSCLCKSADLSIWSLGLIMSGLQTKLRVDSNVCWTGGLRPSRERLTNERSRPYVCLCVTLADKIMAQQTAQHSIKFQLRLFSLLLIIFWQQDPLGAALLSSWQSILKTNFFFFFW